MFTAPRTSSRPQTILNFVGMVCPQRHDLRATPLGFCWNSTPSPGLRAVRHAHAAPPWADLEPPRWGFRGLAVNPGPLSSVAFRSRRNTVCAQNTASAGGFDAVFNSLIRTQPTLACHNRETRPHSLALARLHPFPIASAGEFRSGLSLPFPEDVGKHLIIRIHSDVQRCFAVASNHVY